MTQIGGEGGELRELLGARLIANLATSNPDGSIHLVAIVKTCLATDDTTIRLRPHTISSWNLRETDQARALLESGDFHRPERVH